MTEKEAIKVIETEKQCVVLRNGENGCDGDCICCDLVMAENDIICGYDTAIKALAEIQQYRAIGTVEECREARERQMGKKPINIRLLETSGVHCGVCPICKNPVYADLKNQNHREYCGHCGQAIDWSDDAIESLSEKMQAVNMETNSRWIAVEKRLPENS